MFSIGEKIAFIESVFGKANISRDMRNVAVWCPICASIDKTKRKLVIKTDDDKTHCWVCGWKARTLAPLIRKFAISRLEEYKEKFSPSTYIGSIDEGSQTETKPVLPPGFRLLILAPLHDLAAKSAKTYVFRRKISERDLWHYKLGVADTKEMLGRVIIPSFDLTGELNFYVARSLGHAKPKYFNSTVSKMNVIFNEINIDWNKPLVVCEGAFDMMKCGDNATPLLGSEITEEYALFDKIITNNTPVILALDDDMDRKKHIFAKKLSEYDIEVKIVDLQGKHDPGSMSKEEFSDVVKDAKRWDWDLSFKYKLSCASQMRLNVSREFY